MLVDSHCHLDYLEREGVDLDEVVARANRAGVGCMVTISTKLSTFNKVLNIAERYDCVYCSVGVHPHEAEEEGASATTERLIELAQHPKVVAIGETGLDYFYEHSPRQQQIDSFKAHIAASRETGLPLIVHTRNADDDTMRIMEEEMILGSYPGLIHCFSSSQELAEKSVELGMSISLSGIVTFKTAKEIRATVDVLSIDNLLVETDAPFLAPVPLRGKQNEPAFVIHTAANVAEIKLISKEELALKTTNNFFNLFTKINKKDVVDLCA